MSARVHHVLVMKSSVHAANSPGFQQYEPMSPPKRNLFYWRSNSPCFVEGTWRWGSYVSKSAVRKSSEVATMSHLRIPPDLSGRSAYDRSCPPCSRHEVELRLD